jgi:DNA-binding protein YbaB
MASCRLIRRTLSRNRHEEPKVGEPWRDAERADAILADAEETMRRIEEAQARLDTVTGEGASDDSLVRALTDAEGMLKEVTFEPRLMRLDRTAIADRVTVAVQQAQQDAKTKVRELLDDALRFIQPLDETFVEDRIAEVVGDLHRHSRGGPDRESR